MVVVVVVCVCVWREREREREMPPPGRNGTFFSHHLRHSSWHGGERVESRGGNGPALMDADIDNTGDANGRRGGGGGNESGIGHAVGLSSSSSLVTQAGDGNRHVQLSNDTGGGGNNAYGTSNSSSSSSSSTGRAKYAHARSGSLGKMMSSLSLPLPLSRADIAPPSNAAPASSPTRSLSTSTLQSLRQYNKSGAAVNGMFNAAMKTEKAKRARRRSMLLLVALSILILVVLLLKPGVTRVVVFATRHHNGYGAGDSGGDSFFESDGIRLVNYRRQQNVPADDLSATKMSRRFTSDSTEAGQHSSMLDIHTMYYGLWEGSFELKEEDTRYSSNEGEIHGHEAAENVNWLPPWPEERHRIAVFTGAYSHIVDGVSLTLNKLVAFLESQGHEVLVVAPTLPGGKSAVKNPPGTLLPTLSLAVPFRPEYRGSLPMTPSMANELNTFAPTIVHIATPDILGLDAMRWVHFYNSKMAPTTTDGKKTAVPVVCSYHTRFNAYLKYYSLQIAEPVLWKYLQSFYSGCSHVYPPTPEVGNELVEHGILPEQVRLWPRGVNITHFSPTRRSDDFRRSIIGVEADDPAVNEKAIMLFVSRLVLEKGLGVFAETVEMMMRDGVDAHVVVVGEGPARKQLEERFRNTMKHDSTTSRRGGGRRAPSWSYSSSSSSPGTTVTFLGAMNGVPLAEAYASSDFFFFPSLTEGWGNVALEAMASGLPVIGAHATGTTFLVKTNITGFLAEPDDAASMLSYVKLLVGNEQLRKSMSARARQWATSFTWDRAFSLLMRHYKEAIDNEISAL